MILYVSKLTGKNFKYTGFFDVDEIQANSLLERVKNKSDKSFKSLENDIDNLVKISDKVPTAGQWLGSVGVKSGRTSYHISVY